MVSARGPHLATASSSVSSPALADSSPRLHCPGPRPSPPPKKCLTSCGTIRGSCVPVVCSLAGEETTAAKEEKWDDDPGEEKRGFTDAQSRAADCGCGWGIQGGFPEKATFKLSCGDSQKSGERRHWRRDNGPRFRTEISWMSGPENRREGGCSSARKEIKWSAHIP